MTVTPMSSTSVAAGDVALASQYNNVLYDIKGFSWARSGRLTLTSTDAVTTTDVSAATTIYYVPFTGSIFNTFRNTSVNFSEVYRYDALSLALNTTDHPANTNFDLYVYHLATSTSAEYLSLVSVAWSTDLTRAEDVLPYYGSYYRDGYGVGFYNFVGSFRTVAAGQTEDSVTKRFLANYYNKVPKNMYVIETTENTSTTDTPALWNASVTNNQLGFVVCDPYGYAVQLGLRSKQKAAVDGQYARTQIHLDGAEYTTPDINVSNYNDQYVKSADSATPVIPTGYHYINAYVYGTDGGTATFARLTLNAQVWV